MTMNEAKTIQGPGLSEVDAAVRAVLADRLPHVRHSRLRQQDAKNRIFAGRLLSLRLAESLGAGLTTIQVGAGTVVTPLARDYLKHRGIAVQVVAKSEADGIRNTGEWGFAIETVSGLMEALRRNLLSANEVWHELGGTLDQSIIWLCEGEGRGVMHLTDDASVAVFQACRTPSVRAALAYDVGSALRAVRTLGVNLLVVEPAGQSIAGLRQVCTTFRRAGGPLMPRWMAEGADR